MPDNPDACGQPSATLWLAGAAGGLLGLAYVAARCLIWPYRMHRFRHP